MMMMRKEIYNYTFSIVRERRELRMTFTSMTFLNVKLTDIIKILSCSFPSFVRRNIDRKTHISNIKENFNLFISCNVLYKQNYRENVEDRNVIGDFSDNPRTGR